MKRIALVLVVLSVFATKGYSNDESYGILTQDLPPWSYEGKTGIIVDSANEIEKRIGTNVKIESTSWSRAQVMTKGQNNKADGKAYLIFPLARVPKRENEYVWVIDVMPSELVFATLYGEPMDIVKAKNAKKIIVQQDTPPQIILTKKGFTNLLAVTKSSTIPQMLDNKRGDAWFGDMNVTKSTIRNTSFEKRMAYGPPAITNRMYIGASKNISKALIDKYRKKFQEIQNDGTYNGIMNKYLKGSP